MGRYDNNNYYQPRPVQTIDARAPYANPNQNIGAINAPALPGSGGLTNDLTWANQFRRNDNQLSALPGTSAPVAASPAASPSISDHIASAINDAIPKYLDRNTQPSSPFDFSDIFAPKSSVAPSPSLVTLAAGGQNHAQQWRVGDSGTAATTPSGSRTLVSPYGSGTTTFGAPASIPQQEDLSGKTNPFGWSSAFR